MLKKLVAGVAALALVASMAWALSMTVRGWVKARLWNGREPLECQGNLIMTLRHKQVKLASGTALTAGGNCRLALVGCELEAASALVVAGNAQVTVDGGKLSSTGQAGGFAERDAAIRVSGSGALTLTNVEVRGATALFAAGGAAVTIHGGRLAGAIERGGNARLVVLP